jgi:excisionase family DNA binding protein
VTGRPLTPDQVAELVQVSRKTVMRAIEAGELEASQLTQKRGGWRIRPEAIDEWMKLRSNRRRPPRSLADVAPVNTTAEAAARARRQSAGRLRVTPDMGRAA